MADRSDWQHSIESELRAMSRHLDIPPAGDIPAAVRHRLEERAAGAGRLRTVSPGIFARRPSWRAALVLILAALAILLATPQGRAVISRVLRLPGVEIRQGRSPAPVPRRTGSLPGQRRMPLIQARHEVSFPILVPAALGRPADVTVSDSGRVAALIYRGKRYGKVLVEEFAGHLDPILFEKFVHFGGVTKVDVNGREGLWIKGPHMLIYIDRDGHRIAESARLTTGNTLVWGTRQVALRLEGNVGERAALAIARSAR